MRYKYQPGGSIDPAKEGQRLRELGYSDEQIMQIIGIEQPNALDQYLKDQREGFDGYVSSGTSLLANYSGAIRSQLVDAGYSEQDVENILGYDESTRTYANPALYRPPSDPSESEYIDLVPNSTSSTSSTDDAYTSLRRQGYTDLSAEKILGDQYGRGYQPGFRRRPEGVYYAPLLGSVGETGQFLTDTFRRFFGGRDTDGDGFRDGSLRDLRRKSTSFDVEIDPNDPNKDNYVYDFDFLNQGKLPTKEEYGQYLQDNTFLDYNTRSGDYDASFKRPGKSYFDEAYEPRNRRKGVSFTDFQASLSDKEKTGFEGLGIMPAGSTFEIADGATVFYEPGEDPRSRKDIKTTMMGQYEEPTPAPSFGPFLESQYAYGGDLNPMYQVGGGFDVMDEIGLLDDQELMLPMSNAVSTANPNFFPQSIPDFTQGVSIQDPGMPTNAMFERAGISIPETPTLDNIQPFTMEQVDAEFANVPEPAFVAPMVDADGDGIPDYIDADAGAGTSNYDQPQIDKKRKIQPTFRKLVGDVGQTAIGGARLLNKYFEDVKARRAERDLKDVYGVAENVMPIAYSDQPSRGISSELTGDIGSEADRYTYLLPAKEGREVTVDDATLLKLMQLGAEIEIL